jgi:hypothetical protein
MQTLQNVATQLESRKKKGLFTMDGTVHGRYDTVPLSSLNKLAQDIYDVIFRRLQPR